MNVTIDNDNLVITLSKEEVAGVNINAGGRYNYAGIHAKIGSEQYFNAGCEWEGKTDVPDFVIAIMGLVKQAKESASISGAWPGKETEYAECIEALKNVEKGE